VRVIIAIKTQREIGSPNKTCGRSGGWVAEQSHS